MYAQWTRVYTVTWYYQNPSGSTTTTQTSGGGNVTGPTVAYTGYAFNGWYDASSGGNLISTNNPYTFAPVSDQSLYAQWTQQVAPSGGSGSVSANVTFPGGTLTLSKTDATGTPTPTASWVWRRADGGVGGNSYTGGTILQTNGLTYTLTSSSVGYAIRAEITWSNGVSPNQTYNTNGTVVTAAPITVSTATYAINQSAGTAQTLTSGTNDDGYYAVTLPFTIYFGGTAYSTIYIGTNSYATFDSGQTTYTPSLTNPSGNKIMVAAGDRSSNNVTKFTGTGQTSPYWAYFYIKGSFGASTTPGSAIVWELYANQQFPKDLYLAIITNPATGTNAVTDSINQNYSSLSTSSGVRYKITSV